jgi:hypothetical protein
VVVGEGLVEKVFDTDGTGDVCDGFGDGEGGGGVDDEEWDGWWGDAVDDVLVGVVEVLR